MSAPNYSRLALVCLVAVIAACRGETSSSSSSTPTTTPPPSTGAAPAPTGRVINIEMTTDEKGNYFKPSKIEAHLGDVLRFVLVAGVHNVHFLPDSNPGKSGLPPVSDFLQIPGQTWDLPVTLAKAHYYFQCDPHAALGMVGTLEVEDEEE